MLGNIVEVDVINGRTIYGFIFIIAATLGIEQLHAHLKVQFLRLVTHPVVSIIDLIGMHSHTGLYMHHQHPIGFPFFIDTIHKMHLYRGCRHVVVQ